MIVKKMSGNIKKRTVIGFSSILLAQMVLFYVLPFTAGPTDVMGLVFV